ncbi:MAG TPA: hypothetical protein ENG40_02945 [Thermoprotei archaeon]|nr:MAG: hypothetical protein DRJ64_01985 [Thermoprotei archaeon]HDJ89632.1 hypothetical protein [Thermoprotei archaeon]
MNEKKIKREEDIEELKEVLSTVSVFLKDLAPTITEIMNAVLGSIDGGKLGKEAGEFYKNLIEAGINAEEASKLTEKFIEQKLTILQLLPQIMQSKTFKRKGIEEKITKEEEDEE